MNRRTEALATSLVSLTSVEIITNFKNNYYCFAISYFYSPGWHILANIIVYFKKNLPPPPPIASKNKLPLSCYGT